MLPTFLGITDNNWFDYLRRNQITDEVNFWVPSGLLQKTAGLECCRCGDFIATIVSESLFGVDREMAVHRVGILSRELRMGFRVGRCP